MEDTTDGLRLTDLIPRDRLAAYLNSASALFGAHLKVLDLTGAVLGSSRTAGQDADTNGPMPADAWARVGEVMGIAPMEVKLGGGYSLLAAPVHFKCATLGYLSACVQAVDGAGERTMGLLSMSVSHLESMADAGLDVESLSGEVVRVYEELALIYGMTVSLTAKVDVSEICRIVMDEARKILDPADIVIQLADYKAGVFRTVLASGEHEELAAGFTPVLDEGIIGQAYTGHRSVLVCDVSEHARFKPWPFHIRRVIAVPLMAEGKVIGMISATDKKDGAEFDSREEKLVSAISSVAAIAIKNAQLYSDIKNLFEGFINAAVTAVEYRDPTTAGHSQRVAAMSVELAMRVSESEVPSLKEIKFSPEQLLEIRYAGLLHDFGKIGVSEAILLKGAKLPLGGSAEIAERFNYIRTMKMYEALEKKHGVLLTQGREAYEGCIGEIDSKLAEELARLDGYQRLIEHTNDPKTLDAGLPEFSTLSEIAKMNCRWPDGTTHPYLTPSEFECLRMPRGSLSQEERKEVEMHVTHSFNFLAKMPWTENLANIAGIVYAHHERVNGSGYPRGIRKDEIPIQARIMAVADVYDALTAWDRPYKEAVSTEKALFILEMEASEGRLDPQLVQVFRDAKVYSAAARRPAPADNGSEA